MNIISIPLHIPFKLTFKHANCARSATETFLIKATSTAGVCGFGEGCPRDYVTGEGLESCEAFLALVTAQIGNIDSLSQLKDYVAHNESLIDKNPAAWCAIEMALLEVFAKQHQQTVAELLELPQNNPVHHYSAVLGIDSKRKAWLYRLFGLRDFKLKVSGDEQKDRGMFRRLKWLGVVSRHLRVDANNLYSDAQTCIDAMADLKSRLWAIEEPLKAHDYAGMKQVAQALAVNIILDESFLCFADLQKFVGFEAHFIVNVRVSRLGGVLRTLKVIEHLKAHNQRFIIGAHVGETSLLGRAGMMLSCAFADHVIAREGAFSTYVLERDPFTPNIRFGRKGLVDERKLSLSNLGWGLGYDE